MSQSSFGKTHSSKNMYVQPLLKYDNKVNRLVVPLYCGTCRTYGCLCYNNIDKNNSKNNNDLTEVTFNQNSGLTSETNSFTDKNNLSSLHDGYNFNVLPSSSMSNVPDSYQGFIANSTKLYDFQSSFYSNNNNMNPSYMNNNDMHSLKFSNNNSNHSLHRNNFDHYPKQTTNKQFNHNIPEKSESYYHINQNMSNVANVKNQHWQPLPNNNTNNIQNFNNFNRNKDFISQSKKQRSNDNLLYNNINTEPPTTVQLRRKPEFNKTHNYNYNNRQSIHNFDSLRGNYSNNNNKNSFYLNKSGHNISNNSLNKDQYVRKTSLNNYTSDKNFGSQSLSSNSSNVETNINQIIRCNGNNNKQGNNYSKPHYSSVQLIFDSYQDLDKKLNKKTMASTHQKQTNQIYTTNTTNRSKKFAAYESILYNNPKISSDIETSTSSSLSNSPTPLLDQFSNTISQYDQYNIERLNISCNIKTTSPPNSSLHRNKSFAFGTTRQPKLAQFQILCRLGHNCRFKRENKCKYFHAVSPKHKYKQDNVIDISDYSIDLNENESLDLEIMEETHNSFFEDQNIQNLQTIEQKNGKKYSKEEDLSLSMYSSNSSLASLKKT